MDDYVKDFVQESEEQITELNNALLDLEQDPDDDEAIEQVFRTAHTLKGNAGAMGFNGASDLAHALEDLLEGIRSGSLEPSPELMDQVFAGVDELERLVDEAREHGEPKTDPTPTIEELREYAAVTSAGDEEIDALLRSVGEPASDTHEVYHARLAIAPGENNGTEVVVALDDAFDLLGTDPTRGEIDDEAFSGGFDAAFASPVGKGAIDAALEPVDAVDDAIVTKVTDRFRSLRDGADVETDDAGADAADASAATDAADSPSPESATPAGASAADMSVDELLADDDVDQFDDLDAAMEDLDDEGDDEGFDELGDAGSFDDLDLGEDLSSTIVEDESEDDEPAEEAAAPDEPGAGTDEPETAEAPDEAGAAADAEAEPEPEPEEEVEDASATFAELQEEVDPVGFDELQDELAELEFDEFDTDDEVGFDELIGDEVDVEDETFLDFEGEAVDDEAIDDLLVDDDVADDEPTAGEEPAATGDADPDVPAGAEATDDATATTDEPETADTDDLGEIDFGEADAPAEADAAGEDGATAEDAVGADDAAVAGADDDAAADDADAADTATADDGFGDDTTDDATADDAFGSADDAFADSGFGDTTDDDGFGDTTDDATADDAFGSAAEATDDGFGDDAMPDDGFGDDDLSADTAGSEDLSTDSLGGDDLDDDAFAGGGFGDEDDGGFGEAGATDDGDDFGEFGEFDEFADEEEDAEEEDDTPDPIEGLDVVTNAQVESLAEAGIETVAELAEADVPRVAGETGLSVTDVADLVEAAGGTVDADLTAPTTGGSTGGGGGGDAMQSVRVDVDQIDSLLNLVEGLVTSRARLRRAVEDGEPLNVIDDELDELEDITAELQDTVMDVRLVPLNTVTNRLPRVVRDVARDQGKEVAFETAGEDVELDRTVLTEIGDPLIHLVRNAVDHGIEGPDEREAAGKDRQGTIELRAERERDEVVIEVVDDGSGLDPDRLREEAVTEGILTEAEAAEMDDEEAYDLVFHPGFSTREEITDVSGRGVGMDVVASTVSELDGSVDVESELGEGTTVRLTLPVTVAIADVLFVEVGGEEYGIPVRAVQEIGPVRNVQTKGGKEIVVTEQEQDDVIFGGLGDDDDGPTRRESPLLRLDDALETPRRGRNGDGRLIHVREDVRSVVLHCDEVRGRQEVVVKPFEGLLGDIPGLSGAAVLGEGEVVNILDVETL